MKGQLGMTLNKIADAIKILDGFALETLENNSNIKLYTIEGTYYLKVKNKKKRLVEVKLNENTNWKNYYLMGSTFGGSALLLNHINKGMYIELVEITKKDYYTRLLEYFHLSDSLWSTKRTRRNILIWLCVEMAYIHMQSTG